MTLMRFKLAVLMMAEWIERMRWIGMVWTRDRLRLGLVVVRVVVVDVAVHVIADVVLDEIGCGAGVCTCTCR